MHYRLALVVAVLVIMAVMLYAAYYYGKIGSELSLARSQQTVGELSQEVESLRQRFADIQGSLARAERQLQIDKTVYAELGAELKSSNQQLVSLRDELRFYRSIISPEDGEAGARFQEFVVAGTDEPRVFAYRLVMIQALQHSRDVEGALTLEINGRRGGNPESLRLPPAGSDDIKVKFKYFQTLEGTFELPDGFVPGAVKVVLTPGQKKSTTVERWYRWSDIFG
jgi:hypothetical protein